MRISHLFESWFWVCWWSDRKEQFRNIHDKIVDWVLEMQYKVGLLKRPPPPRPPLDRWWRNDAMAAQEHGYTMYTSITGARAINRMMEAEAMFGGVREVEETVRPVRKRAEVSEKLPPVRKYIYNEMDKLTDDQLLRELRSIYTHQEPGYDSKRFRWAFKKRLFNRDRRQGYKRRSFYDLFLYFRPKGVTEIQLMRVLGHPRSGFVGFRCPDINRIVFYRQLLGSRGGQPNRRVKFTSYGRDEFARYIHPRYNQEEYVDKYNLIYLSNLYDQIYEQ